MQKQDELLPTTVLLLTGFTRFPSKEYPQNIEELVDEITKNNESITSKMEGIEVIYKDISSELLNPHTLNFNPTIKNHYEIVATDVNRAIALKNELEKESYDYVGWIDADLRLSKGFSLPTSKVVIAKMATLRNENGELKYDSFDTVDLILFKSGPTAITQINQMLNQMREESNKYTSDTSDLDLQEYSKVAMTHLNEKHGGEFYEALDVTITLRSDEPLGLDIIDKKDQLKFNELINNGFSKDIPNLIGFNLSFSWMIERWDNYIELVKNLTYNKELT